jgi:hypothetical protein
MNALIYKLKFNPRLMTQDSALSTLHSRPIYLTT